MKNPQYLVMSFLAFLALEAGAQSVDRPIDRSRTGLNAPAGVQDTISGRVPVQGVPSSIPPNTTIAQANGPGTIPPPITLSNFKLERRNNNTEVFWTTAREQDMRGYVVEWSRDGRNFTDLTFLGAQGYGGSGQYSFIHLDPPRGLVYYRLRMEDNSGGRRYSQVLQIEANPTGQPMIYPTVVRNGVVQLMLEHEAEVFRLVNMQGGVVMQKQRLAAGSHTLSLPALQPGVYIADIVARNGRISTKIVVER